jgi:hypothetical protein
MRRLDRALGLQHFSAMPLFFAHATRMTRPDGEADGRISQAFDPDRSFDTSTDGC